MELTQEARDNLFNRYVLPTLNDRAWSARTSTVSKCSFGQFTQRSREFINAIESQWVGCLMQESLGYIMAELWYESGREDLTPAFLRKYRPDGAMSAEKYFSEKELDGVEQSYRERAGNKAAQTATQIATQPTSTEKEITMKTESISIKTITYINNVAIDNMSADQLIDAISTCEAEITDMKSIKTKSEAIAAKIKRVQDTITQLVGILDAK